MTRIAALSLLACAYGHADNWPEFRGPTRDGHVPQVQDSFPTEWSESKNVVWRTPIHDRAWSTPAIWGDQLWLTTASPDGQKLYVIVLDKNSGGILLDQLLYEIASPEPLGNAVNTYASPSPVIEEGHAYVNFGSYGTACFDTKTLKKTWERRDLPCRHFRGPGSSPILHENLLILTMDGIDFQYLVALNKLTGETVWRRDRSTEWNDLDAAGKPTAEGDFRKAYYTPSIVEMPDKSLQLVAPGAKAHWAYDPKTGMEIWQIKHAGFSGASRSVFHGQLALVNTGYSKAEVWAVDLMGAKGDITSTQVKWKTNRRTPNRASPLLVDGLFYMISDDGILSCLNPTTGESLWYERVEGNYSASPIVAKGRIYLCNEQGLTTIVKAGSKFEKVGENQLEEGVLASPASDGKSLFLRTKAAVYRLENKP